MYSFCFCITFELFPVWVLMNNTAIKISVQVLWWTYVCISAVEYIYRSDTVGAKCTILVDSFLSLYNFNNSVGLIVVSHHGFHLYFPDVVERLFQIFIGHLEIIFYKVSVQIFCLFFNWVVFFYRSVGIIYIFWKWVYLFLLYVTFPILCLPFYSIMYLLYLLYLYVFTLLCI